MYIQGKSHINGMPNLGYTKPATNDEVDNGFIDNVADTAQRTKKAFESFAPHAPQNVKNAWDKAAADTGYNGLGLGENGMMTHIPAALVIQVEQHQNNGNTDVFGNSVGSAKDAATRILERLQNPITPEPNSKIRSYQEQEMQFYEAFVANLEDYGADLAALRGLRLN